MIVNKALKWQPTLSVVITQAEQVSLVSTWSERKDGRRKEVKIAGRNLPPFPSDFPDVPKPYE
jgi:hypothetical protein